MKRHPALQQLSRDHLKALLVAKQLREARDRRAASETFARFWDAEQHHFRLEEEVVLPHWAAATAADRVAVVRIAQDHLGIRRDALRLTRGGLSLVQLRDLGARLHDHVRFEERELFPMIERTLDADSLDRLGNALANAHIC